MSFIISTMHKITTTEIKVRLLKRLENAYKRELELLEFEYVVSHEVDRDTFIECRKNILIDLSVIKHQLNSLTTINLQG